MNENGPPRGGPFGCRPWLTAHCLVHCGPWPGGAAVPAIPPDPSRSPEQGVSCESRNVRLLANPIGADASVRTETIHIQPGQFIEWRLESQLARSTVAVY